MANKNNLRNQVMGNLAWRFAERCGAQGVSFIVSIILARLLGPSDYGTVALLTVFITILNVFVDSGLGNALIQKKDADNLDFSTVFVFNMIMCIVLYIALFFLSPLIASFYGDSTLTPLMRALGLTLVISGIKNIQQAYVSRNLIFKRFFYATLGGTIIAAVVGIALAYHGFGAWALVVQHVLNATIDTAILYITVRWRPHLQFSWMRFKGLFDYGWKLLASGLLDTVYNNIRQLIIGRFYSSEDLAFYNQGVKYPQFVVGNINTAIDSVLLPAMSKEQDDQNRVKAMTRRSIVTSTYIMAPIMIGIAVTAEPLVNLLLTDKWLPCVLYLRIFCITYMFFPVHTANLNAIRAMGRSDVFLRMEIVKKIVGLSLMFSTIFISVEAMAYSLLLTTIISTVINAFPNKTLLGYSWSEQMRDILPGIMLAVVMGGCVYPLQWLELSDIAILCIQVILGMGIYIGGSALLKLDSFQYIYGLVQPVIKGFHQREGKQ
ncbi:lipopolysaccharide biosynthesis protein [Pseudoflavonifractor sp. An44]|uniref:lipopolysaccharide biosynthesis protein n=1 Tax=Pseudoflavonifractor sp. An44 TaxID=1965635 RepID=UPI000B398B18|nr:lipopolysaccharide biosynthesis protein [Pseudoflavonifractor sp. An44]OUN95453.1 lipopolysaccharide biosynthesis protein [Pseudoflavonifractor sp. An44]